MSTGSLVSGKHISALTCHSDRTESSAERAFHAWLTTKAWFGLFVAGWDFTAGASFDRGCSSEVLVAWRPKSLEYLLSRLIKFEVRLWLEKSVFDLWLRLITVFVYLSKVLLDPIALKLRPGLIRIVKALWSPPVVKVCVSRIYERLLSKLLKSLSSLGRQMSNFLRCVFVDTRFSYILSLGFFLIGQTTFQKLVYSFYSQVLI